jgi:hypothetical protein
MRQASHETPTRALLEGDPSGFLDQNSIARLVARARRSSRSDFPGVFRANARGLVAAARSNQSA